MTTAALLNANDEAAMEFAAAGKPLPLNSLIAAGQRLTKKNLKRKGYSKPDAWQEDAWDMFDLVGEQRFLATTLANRLSQARFFVGKLPQDSTEDIEPVTEGKAYDIFESIQGKGMHFQQMVQRLGVNLFIPGDGYLVGMPPKKEEKEDAASVRVNGIRPVGAAEEEDEGLASIDLKTLSWQMCSLNEVSVDKQSGEVVISSGEDDDSKRKFKSVDDLILIRVWRPHPRHWWKADSPTRSSLPVLRELVGLTMGVSAQIDSRLAGAGVLFVPQSADQALRAESGRTSDEDISPFAEALMDAMVAAIQDRSSASALVPLMPVVPDESIEKFKWIMHPLAEKLSGEYRELREEAIRRLAMGQDCPPELLLGVSGMNHWGAWLVREDVVTTHLEPPLALMCDAITTQFLWPVLEEQGETDFEDYVIWYDVDHMIQRPNQTQNAKDAKEANVISDEAYRDALGFDEGDAPELDPKGPVKELVLEMLRTAPSLAQNPGLPILAQQIQDMLDGKVTPLPGQPAPGDEAAETDPEAEGEQPEEGGTPATADDPAAEPGDGEGLAASGFTGRRWCGQGHPHGPHEECSGVFL